MAICYYCFNDMLGGEGCIEDALHRNGETARRVRFGEEHRSWGKGPYCNSCGTGRGQCHHPGCDIERCSCGWQAFTCGCLYDEDGPLDILESIGYEEGIRDNGEWDARDRELAAIVERHANELDRGTRRLPLESLTRPMALRHAERLTSASHAGLDEYELQVTALVWDSLTPAFNTAGRLQLARKMMVPIVNKARVLVQQSYIEWPDRFVPILAATLTTAAEGGALDTNSDPLEVLLQPLKCHYGLGDEPSAEPCQCFIDFDPLQPPGTVWLRIHTGQLVLAVSPQLAEPTPTGVEPLDVFCQEYQLQGQGQLRELSHLILLGQIEPTSSSQRFWVYGRHDIPGPRDTLALDSSGVAHQAKADRRYRSNHRWERVPIWQASHGLEHYPEYDPAQV